MSEQLVNSYVAYTHMTPTVDIQKRETVRYEVYANRTLVLRTIHQQQALRYAQEVGGSVTVVSHTS
jgi:hypothetical protein